MPDQPSIEIIVAMAQNRVIGISNQLPWYLPQDLKHFQKLTTHSAIVMGRLTLESIGRPLKNRQMYAISRQRDYSSDYSEVFPNIEAAIAKAKQDGFSRIFIIGGEQIYKEALQKDLVDIMHITEIEREFAGDAFFPEFDKEKWFVEIGERQTEGKISFRFITYKKK